MAMVAAGILAFFIFLTSRLASPEMSLLYAELDGQDSGQIVARLEQLRVPYRLTGYGSQIFVPGDQVARLNADLVQLARLSEAAGSERRFLPIPLFDDTPVQQLRLFLRRRRTAKGGGVEEGDGATRFVLDVDLSRIGGMQLDGLVRDRRFDLILRTRHPLSDEMRRDIAEICGDANAAAGHRRQISFQASGDWSFIPLENSSESGAGLLA